MSSRIWLGPSGSESLLNAAGNSPVTIREGEVRIERAGRVANGARVADIIADKKRFSLDYQTIDQVELAVILPLWELGTTLVLRIERFDTTIDEYVVMFEPFSRRRIVAMDRWLYDGVALSLEEV